uniref:L-type lectin-like domain-containing protein n=1 Tax=Vombatus ursinus TaxID=29139 RepID=A0A4X2KTK3_VOMUR
MESGPSPLLYLFCLLLPSYQGQARAAPPWHRRFEYKFSFKGPRLAVVGQEIPFWNHHGDAIPGLEEVRLAPSMRNKSGAMWTQAAIPFPNWEVEVAFHVSGLGRLGAEGMVSMWYIRDRGQTGPALGGPAFWDGIGILFDSYDNDDQNNPVIQVLANDGQIPYDHLRDGGGQVLGSCLRDFRNRLYPFRARITYWEQKLRVSNPGVGLTLDEVCTEVGPLLLPPGGFFGVSAATGTLAGKDPQMSLGGWQEDVAPTGALIERNHERVCYCFPCKDDSLQSHLPYMSSKSKKTGGSQLTTHPGEGYLDLELTLKRHSRVLEQLQDLSGKMTLTVGQWRSQMQSLEMAAGSASLIFLSPLGYRAAAAHITSKAKAFHLPVGTEHHFQELHQTLALLQRDVESVLPLPVRLGTHRVGWGVLCLSRGIFLLFLLIQTGCVFYCLLFRWVIMTPLSIQLTFFFKKPKLTNL